MTASVRWGRILIGVSLLFGVVAWLVSRSVIEHVEHLYRHRLAVVVAAARLHPGEKLTPSLLRTRHIPEEFITKPFFGKAQSLVGSRVTVSVEPGQVIRPREVTRGLGLPAGEYLISVLMKKHGIGAQGLRHGEYVDLVAAVTQGKTHQAVTVAVHNVLVWDRPTPVSGGLEIHLAVPLPKLLRVAWLEDFGSHMRFVRLGRLPVPVTPLPAVTAG